MGRAMVNSINNPNHIRITLKINIIKGLLTTIQNITMVLNRITPIQTQDTDTRIKQSRTKLLIKISMLINNNNNTEEDLADLVVALVE